MDGDIEWALYRTFLAVLEIGTLSGAARLLGVAQPTVGRQIAALEQGLALALFTRSQTGFLPTEAARALAPHARAMASTAAALERAAAGCRGGDAAGGVDGVVRISASDVIGIEVLPAILARLRARYPALALELVLSNTMHDLLQREADIAVRMTPPRQDQLVARRIGTIDLGLYARDDYLDRRGMPVTPDDLAGHTLISYDRAPPYARDILRAWPALRRDRCAVRVDSEVAQLGLIRAGAGIGGCQSALARRDARLVRVLPDAFSVTLDTWIAMHEDLRASPRCRVVFDALADGLSDYASR